MAFGLSKKTISQIKSVFKKHPEIALVKIYGSRATGGYRKGSDIDLAFFSKSKKKLSAQLAWNLDDLPTPYLFDIVDYNKLKKGALKTDINQKGRIFYQKPLIQKESASQKNFVKPKQPAIETKPVIEKKSGKKND